MRTNLENARTGVAGKWEWGETRRNGGVVGTQLEVVIDNNTRPPSVRCGLSVAAILNNGIGHAGRGLRGRKPSLLQGSLEVGRRFGPFGAAQRSAAVGGAQDLWHQAETNGMEAGG